MYNHLSKEVGNIVSFMDEGDYRGLTFSMRHGGLKTITK